MSPRSLHLVGWLVVLALAAWLCSEPPGWLNCRCGYGSVKYRTASIGFGLIAARAMVAVVLRERSPWWAAYLVLALLVAPLVESVVTAAGGH